VAVVKVPIQHLLIVESTGQSILLLIVTPRTAPATPAATVAINGSLPIAYPTVTFADCLPVA
jgi:hypothetical protein